MISVRYIAVPPEISRHGYHTFGIYEMIWLASGESRTRIVHCADIDYSCK